MMVKQKNRFDCLAAVLAMMIGTDIEDIYLQLGHDGTMLDGDNNRRPIRMIEVIRVAAIHGFLLGSYFNVTGPKNQLSPALNPKGPALLIVVGATTPHAVFYDGRNIYDPNQGRVGTYDMDDYQVLQYWPISRIGLRGRV